MLPVEDDPRDVAYRTLDAFTAENEELDKLLASLSYDVWSTPTPSEGWTIARQVAHLTLRAQDAIEAMTDRRRLLLTVERASPSPHHDADYGGLALANRHPETLLTQWREAREQFESTSHGILEGDISSLPGAGSERLVTIATAYGLMRTWAHAQDIFDALDRPRMPSERLWYVADLGIGMDDPRFTAHGVLPLGQMECRIELASPIGALWIWGDPTAAARLRGTAEDFCLYVTRRRTRWEVELTATMEVEAWMSTAPMLLAPAGRGYGPISA
ncbi:maleylpyruvate isomerase family mycothiol-dependent enzyme [Tenggerimyces flavus]|uniref:Maleylpyruvate isomerase family mycothiol-dependent enzyme n=1 Tax=Tenggerimyces flavus TaxID=1708749 RepID=A0ABV7YMG9_9ACTN|nr:maleylpyruvate isomerase family mycothiol-dependent enzyme [Tenggerimyces flavus]MBM7790180.1 uncharacterized protein (TIGR03084 family) [Tenggerimyces flavus]